MITIRPLAVRVPRGAIRLAWIAVLFPAGLRAQVPFNACLDRQGHPINGVVDNSIPYAAEAAYRDGHRVILWNQHQLGRVPSTVQLFIYLHECAHHTLNHLSAGESLGIETQANCWAIQLMVDGGMINGSHLEELTRDLKQWGGDVNHLGGAALLQSLTRCLDIRTDPAAWDSTLQALTAAAPGGFMAVRGRPVEDASPGSYETTVGAPGTYDCEENGTASVKCLIFAARKQKAVAKRFEEVERILHDWLPAAWTSRETDNPSPAVAREFTAQDGTTGSILVLALTQQARLYFLVQQGTPPATA
ncbi:MAG TPA: hypothetical protein VNH46_04900, partial [Gemmatimonadales bacterium]|nr:hypothetical protein [Gemmatimonadales bacterium]